VSETKSDPPAPPEPAEPEGTAAEAETTASDTAEASAGEAPAVEAAKKTSSHLKWYAVQTYSGFEFKAQKSLEERAKLEGLEEFLGDILVPSENVVEMMGGTKRRSNKKFFPGYMFVQMELNDRMWHLVKTTPKVAGFVGDSQHPVPLREREVRRLTQTAAEGATERKPRITYTEGETVRVTEGAFATFNGTVEEVRDEKQKLRVLVTIFGRSTPVELDFDQVEKVAK
jgi:transcriptional antiterminator NusG